MIAPLFILAHLKFILEALDSDWIQSSVLWLGMFPHGLERVLVWICAVWKGVYREAWDEGLPLLQGATNILNWTEKQKHIKWFKI